MQNINEIEVLHRQGGHRGGSAPRRELFTLAFFLLLYPPGTMLIDLDLVSGLVRKKIQSWISSRFWSVKKFNLGSRLGPGPGFSKNWMQLLGYDPTQTFLRV